jgi:signal transduction histidine kinase
VPVRTPASSPARPRVRPAAGPGARPGGRNALLTDTVLAAGLAAAAAVAGAEYHPAPWPRFDAAAYVLSALVVLPLALRRRAPVAVLVASCAAYGGYLAAGYQPSLDFWGPAIALYGVAAHRPPRVAAVGAGLTAVVMFCSGLAAREVGVVLSVVQAVAVPGVVWAVGNGARLLADRNRRLTAVTAQLHREQEERARQAVTEERVRIARELHDVVAHHMSVISVQAGLAGYVFADDPPTARAALDTIAATSREALEELRRMLALLRVDPDGDEDGEGDEDCTEDGNGDGDRDGGGRGGASGDGGGYGTVEADGRGGTGSYRPAPDLGDLAGLAERVTAAGVPVEVRTEGVVRPLPAGVGLCAYRVVQEALTNVLKYARPCRATVRVVYGRDTLAIEVADDGRGTGADAAEGGGSGKARGSRTPAASRLPAGRAAGGGHGLIGMRERARILGGTLSAGPRPEGGFAVELTLPVPASHTEHGARRSLPPQRRHGPDASRPGG